MSNTKRVYLGDKADEEYVNWLENMLTMLSKNYLDLVHASDEDTLKSVSLPKSNETRKAIRLISQNALLHKESLEDERIEKFTQVIIENQRLKSIVIENSLNEKKEHVNILFTIPTLSSISLFEFERLINEKTIELDHWLNPLLTHCSQPFFHDFQIYHAKNIYVVCMLAAYLEKRQPNIKEFADCINNFEKLKKLTSSTEKYYDLYISESIIQSAFKNNIFSLALNSVKSDLLGQDTDKAFAYTEELRTTINKIKQDMQHQYSVVQEQIQKA